MYADIDKSRVRLISQDVDFDKSQLNIITLHVDILFLACSYMSLTCVFHTLCSWKWYVPIAVFYDERIFISFFKVRFHFNKIFSENLGMTIYLLGFLVYCFAVKSDLNLIKQWFCISINTWNALKEAKMTAAY